MKRDQVRNPLDGEVMVKKGLTQFGPESGPTLESTTRELNHVRFALDQAAIVAVTDQAGTIIHINDKFCEISKYSREELLGQNHRLINSGHHSREFFEQMWQAISSGKIWEGEIRNRAKDGAHYWVNTTIVPFPDQNGEPYQYVAIRYEITQQKSAEEHLRKSEESLRSLFDATFEGVLVHDLEGHILDVNEAAAEIFGYSRNEMLRTSVFRYCEEVGQKSLLEAIGTHKDGTTLSLEVRSKAYIHRGDPVRLTTIRDISSRKQLEAQILMQDRLASVGLLASSLAHEIGTPLGVIRGRAEYLGLQLKDDAKIRKNVDVIVSQIDRVTQLIRSLLNLARGDQIRSADEIQLNLVVAEVIDLMGHELRKNEIEIRNEVLLETPIRVNAEAGPLHQVLLNLLVNSVYAIGSAVKAGRKIPHSIRIFTSDEGDQWALSVADTGSGISPENMRNLFKPFFTTKGIGVGTGLGLATSYRIVESWGGTIQVESEDGVGTTFRVLLPKASKRFK